MGVGDGAVESDGSGAAPADGSGPSVPEGPASVGPSGLFLLLAAAVAPVKPVVNLAVVLPHHHHQKEIHKPQRKVQLLMWNCCHSETPRDQALCVERLRQTPLKRQQV